MEKCQTDNFFHHRACKIYSLLWDHNLSCMAQEFYSRLIAFDFVSKPIKIYCDNTLVIVYQEKKQQKSRWPETTWD